MGVVTQDGLYVGSETACYSRAGKGPADQTSAGGGQDRIFGAEGVAAGQGADCLLSVEGRDSGDVRNAARAGGGNRHHVGRGACQQQVAVDCERADRWRQSGSETAAVIDGDAGNNPGAVERPT